MNLPDWLQDLTEEFGAQRLAGDITRAEAVTALRDKILAQDDRTLTGGILAEFAGRVLDAWHRTHLHPLAAGEPAHLQLEMFPHLPPRLHIRPGVTKAPIDFTAHDWDTAREMVRARTENAVNGAQEDWQQFEAAYGRVRPLLSGDLTTADVADRLAGGGAAPEITGT